MYLLYRLGSDTDIHPSGCNQVDLVATGFESSDAVMDAVAATLNDHGGPGSFAMGVISHLSSVPACVLPVARFCVALQGVPVLVDGAREYSLHRFGRSARLKDTHSCGYCRFEAAAQLRQRVRKFVQMHPVTLK